MFGVRHRRCPRRPTRSHGDRVILANGPCVALGLDVQDVLFEEITCFVAEVLVGEVADEAFGLDVWLVNDRVGGEPPRRRGRRVSKKLVFLVERPQVSLWRCRCSARCWSASVMMSIWSMVTDGCAPLAVNCPRVVAQAPPFRAEAVACAVLGWAGGGTAT